jgi:hypothetical protein
MGLQQNGSFSVKSMYLALITDNRVMSEMTIWKLNISLKIKIFMWYLKCVVLTKDNLIRRNWKATYAVQTVELVQPCKRAIQGVRFELCGGTRRDVHFAKKCPPTQFFLQISPLSWERNGTLGGLRRLASCRPAMVLRPPPRVPPPADWLRPPTRLPSRSRSTLVRSPPPSAASAASSSPSVRQHPLFFPSSRPT